MFDMTTETTDFDLRSLVIEALSDSDYEKAIKVIIEYYHYQNAKLISHIERPQGYIAAEDRDRDNEATIGHLSRADSSRSNSLPRSLHSSGHRAKIEKARSSRRQQIADAELEPGSETEAGAKLSRTGSSRRGRSNSIDRARGLERRNSTVSVSDKGEDYLPKLFLLCFALQTLSKERDSEFDEKQKATHSQYSALLLNEEELSDENSTTHLQLEYAALLRNMDAFFPTIGTMLAALPFLRKVQKQSEQLRTFNVTDKLSIEDLTNLSAMLNNVDAQFVNPLDKTQEIYPKAKQEAKLLVEQLLKKLKSTQQFEEATQFEGGLRARETALSLNIETPLSQSKAFFDPILEKNYCWKSGDKINYASTINTYNNYIGMLDNIVRLLEQRIEERTQAALDSHTPAKKSKNKRPEKKDKIEQKQNKELDDKLNAYSNIRRKLSKRVLSLLYTAALEYKSDLETSPIVPSSSLDLDIVALIASADSEAVLKKLKQDFNLELKKPSPMALFEKVKSSLVAWDQEQNIALQIHNMENLCKIMKDLILRRHISIQKKFILSVIELQNDVCAEILANYTNRGAIVLTEAQVGKEYKANHDKLIKVHTSILTLLECLIQSDGTSPKSSDSDAEDPANASESEGEVHQKREKPTTVETSAYSLGSMYPSNRGHQVAQFVPDDDPRDTSPKLHNLRSYNKRKG